MRLSTASKEIGIAMFPIDEDDNAVQALALEGGRMTDTCTRALNSSINHASNETVALTEAHSAAEALVDASAEATSGIARIPSLEEVDEEAINRRKREKHNIHVRRHREKHKRAVEQLKRDVEEKSAQLRAALDAFLSYDEQMRALEARDGVSRDSLWRSYGLLVQQREKLQEENTVLRERHEVHLQFQRRMLHSLEVASDEFFHPSSRLNESEQDEAVGERETLEFKYKQLDAEECNRHVRDAYSRAKLLRTTFSENCGRAGHAFAHEVWNGWQIHYSHQEEWDGVTEDRGAPEESPQSPTRKQYIRFRFSKEIDSDGLSIDDIARRCWQVENSPGQFAKLYHFAVGFRVLQRVSGDTIVTHRTYPGLGRSCAQLLALVTRLEDESDEVQNQLHPKRQMVIVGTMLNPDDHIQDFERVGSHSHTLWLRDGLSYLLVEYANDEESKIYLEYGGMVACVARTNRGVEEAVKQVVLATGQSLLRLEQSVLGPHTVLPR